MAAGTFTTGLRDGFPLYQMIKRPEMPAEASKQYGAGMITGGIASVAMGIAAPAAYFMLGGSKVHARGTVMSNVLFGASVLWALPNVLGGVGAAFTGANIIAGG